MQPQKNFHHQEQIKSNLEDFSNLNCSPTLQPQNIQFEKFETSFIDYVIKDFSRKKFQFEFQG